MIEKSYRLGCAAFLSLFLISSTALAQQVTGTADRGGTGLFRTKSAQIMEPGYDHFQIHLRSEYYRDFTHFTRDLKKLMVTSAITYAPIRYAEFYFSVDGLSNLESGSDAAGSNQAVTQFGNYYIGAKGTYPINQDLALGLNAELESLAPVRDLGGQDWVYDGTFTLLASYDFTRGSEAIRRLPLRLHANLGFKYDKGRKLIPSPVPASWGYDAFTLEIIGYNRLQGRFGAEVPLRYAVFSAEYTTMQTIKDIGYGFWDQTNYLTFGSHFYPTSSKIFSVDLAVDVGLGNGSALTRPTTRYGAAPDWNLIFGLTFASFDRSGKAAAVEEKKEEPKKEEPAAASGTLSGKAVDDQSGAALAGAKLTIAEHPEIPPLETDALGMFISPTLPAGTYTVKVEKEGYETQTLPGLLQPDKPLPLDIKMVKKAVVKGKLYIKLLDAAGQPLDGMIRLIDFPKMQPIEVKTTKGGLVLKLKPDSYNIEVEVAGYDPDKKTLTVKENEQTEAFFTLRQKGRVELKKGKIAIRDKVQFKYGKAEIDPASSGLLNEVAQLINSNPQIKKVTVEGYTDNAGTPAANKTLSKARAQAVMKYLVGQQVPAEKLAAVGYGQEKPLASNKTKTGQAKNRRVEFKVEE